MVSFISFFGDIDIPNLIVNSFAAAIVTLILIILFRPRLKIVDACKDEVPKENSEPIPFVRFTIKNIGFFTATNINCEACFIDDNYTYHLDFERDKFILIPGRSFCKVHERTFKAYAISEDTILAMKTHPNSFSSFLSNFMQKPFRVRVFSNHGLTGFGRKTERIFDKICIAK